MSRSYDRMSSRRAPAALDYSANLDRLYFDSSRTSDSSPANGQLQFRNDGASIPQHSMIQQGTVLSPLIPVSYQGFATLQSGPEFQGPCQFASYGLGTERREKGSSSPTSSNAEEAGTDSASNMPSSGQERRRAQNRSAQRAFRIRKIQRAKSLEQDLAALISEHGNLLTSYERQGDELNELRTRIANLQNELAQLRMSQGRDLDFGGMVTPDQFDGWQFDAFDMSDPIGVLSLETEEQDQTGGASQEPATWPAFEGSI